MKLIIAKINMGRNKEKKIGNFSVVPSTYEKLFK